MAFHIHKLQSTCSLSRAFPLVLLCLSINVGAKTNSALLRNFFQGDGRFKQEILHKIQLDLVRLKSGTTDFDTLTIANETLRIAKQILRLTKNLAPMIGQNQAEPSNNEILKLLNQLQILRFSLFDDVERTEFQMENRKFWTPQTSMAFQSLSSIQAAHVKSIPSRLGTTLLVATSQGPLYVKFDMRGKGPDLHRNSFDPRKFCSLSQTAKALGLETLPWQYTKELRLFLDDNFNPRIGSNEAYLKRFHEAHSAVMRDIALANPSKDQISSLSWIKSLNLGPHLGRRYISIQQVVVQNAEGLINLGPIKRKLLDEYSSLHDQILTRLSQKLSLDPFMTLQLHLIKQHDTFKMVAHPTVSQYSNQVSTPAIHWVDLALEVLGNEGLSTIYRSCGFDHVSAMELATRVFRSKPSEVAVFGRENPKEFLDSLVVEALHKTKSLSPARYLGFQPTLTQPQDQIQWIKDVLRLKGDLRFLNKFFKYVIKDFAMEIQDLEDVSVEFAGYTQLKNHQEFGDHVVGFNFSTRNKFLRDLKKFLNRWTSDSQVDHFEISIYKSTPQGTPPIIQEVSFTPNH